MARTLGLTGDVMLGRLVDDRQESRPPAAVWGHLAAHLRSLDALAINLECCLSTRGGKWTETYRPFHFRADPSWAVPALREAGVDYASLANNHLLDFGPVALGDTVAALSDAGIAHAGAGEDERAARDPAVFALGDLTVAAVAFTDNTPEYAAGPDSPGVARVEMDVDDADERRLVRETVDRARRHDPDLLVASLHWGPNMEAFPAEQYRRFGRWLTAAGVDLVHGHSAHVFQGVEVHEGGLILYDCGDFVDDYAVDDDLRNDRSFLFEVTVGDDGILRELRLRPTGIDDCAVHRAGGAVAAWCRERMRERSAPFGTADRFRRVDRGLALDL